MTYCNRTTSSLNLEEFEKHVASYIIDEDSVTEKRRAGKKIDLKKHENNK